MIDAAIAKAADEAGVPVALLTAEPGFFQACQTLEDNAFEAVCNDNPVSRS